jgi:hypothetical protein
MRFKRLFACSIAVVALANAAAAQDSGQSNEQIPSPKLIEDSYPLAGDAARQKTTKLLQQLVVDLLATVNNYKEAHWNWAARFTCHCTSTMTSKRSYTATTLMC